jgi:hypothetical protein
MRLNGPLFGFVRRSPDSDLKGRFCQPRPKAWLGRARPSAPALKWAPQPRAYLPP